MYTNDFNTAYEYERRAAADSQRSRGLESKQRSDIPAPVMITGVVAGIIAPLRVL